MLNSLRDIIVRPGVIYVDGHQDYAPEARQAPGFKVVGLSWQGPDDSSPKSCDWAWLTVDGRLVAGEEKKPKDLTNSLSSRRLQRELRGLVAEADVAVLGLRTARDLIISCCGAYFLFEEGYLDAEREVNKWGNLGRVVFLPPGKEECLLALSALASILGDPLALPNLSIVAGSDIKRPRARDSFERALMRLFNGVGEKTAEKIAAYFRARFPGTSVWSAAMQAEAVVWKEAGANKRVVEQLERLRKV